MLVKTGIPIPTSEEKSSGLKSYAKTTTAKIIARGVEDVLSHKEAASTKKGKFIGEIARGVDGQVDLRAEIAKRPSALWVKAKAIEADKENDNGDYFSREELIKSYKTFEGVPIFTNHQNGEVENAKGKVVLAEWDERTGSVFCTFFVDREAHPDICRMIEEGYITDVSMGTQVDFSTCSICGNKAQTADTYCAHIKNMKGRQVDGKKVFERNYGLKFIELSIVTDGACEDCTIRELVDPEDFQIAKEELQKAAANNINRLVATGAILKEAGQQELQDLNEAMDLVTGVIQSMLAQRQFIDLEFMQKLGEILAELQHQVDELVDQGYGNVGPENQAAAAQPQVPPIPETASQTGAMPPAAEAAPGGAGVGKITEPMAASSTAMSKFSASVKDLRDLVQKISNETKEHTGGLRNVGSDKTQETIRKLATIWGNPSVRQYTTEVSEGDFKIVVGKDEVIGLRGGQKIASLKIADQDQDIRDGIKANPHEYASHMLDGLKLRFNSVEAAKAPTDSAAQQQQTMEAQLESQRLPLHPREKDVRENITEDQLETKRDGYDKHARNDKVAEEITEKQLRSVPDKQFDRQGSEVKETQELQLRNKGIKGNVTPADQSYAKGVADQLETLPEKQLDQHRGGETDPKDAITEKQLKDQDAPWGRRIASKEDAKLAIAAVNNALAKTVIATGATPEELVGMAIAMTSSPSASVKNGEMIEKSAGKAESREQMLRRASYHGSKLNTSVEDVKEYLLGSLADKGFVADVGMTVLATVARKANAAAVITEEVKKEQEPKAKVVEASASDFLAEAINEETEETVRVDLPVADIKVDQKDKDAFAKAAFELATKVAGSHGMKVSKTVSVAVEDRNAKVSVLASKMSEEEKKAFAAEELKIRKEARRKVVAQTPGGGGMPAAPGGDPMGGGGTTMPAAPMGDPTGAGMPPVGALSAPAPDEVAPEGKEEGGEAQPPGSICPACGAKDVDAENGEIQCNSCGAKGTITVKIDMLKWPGALTQKGPEMGEEGGEEIGAEPEGIGEMGGGPGLEMPQVGVAASFKVTPEMIKKANNKPIGSFCPTCGSSKVKLALKQGAGRGNCQSCGNSHKVDIFVDENDQKSILARVEWNDLGVKKMAEKQAQKMVETSAKAEKLEKALAFKGMTEQFKKANLEQKAKMIDELLKKGLLD